MFTKFACPIFLSLFLCAVSLAADTDADSDIEGVYEGSMHLTDGGEERDIPISTTLSLSGEVIKVPEADELFEKQRVIEGAFVVDEEGGPFAFSSVRYQLERNQIDMKYIRPENNLKPIIPVDFRLLGNLGKGGTISGKVISGSRGPMGTFKLTKTKKTGLTVKTKYFGKWGGKLEKPDGTSMHIQIAMSTAAGSPTFNPRHFELEYTRGKVATLIVRGVQDVAIPFNNVVIDYFRRLVYLNQVNASGTSALSYEATIDFDKGTLSGHADSALKGRSGDFNLKKVK